MSSDPEKVTRPGDTLDLTENTFDPEDGSCICDFDHCPFLHEMPVNKEGFISAPNEWYDD